MLPKADLEVTSLLIQIISFPIATFSLYLARKEAKASRDLQIVLNLSEGFRSRWDGGWDDALNGIEQAQRASLDNEIPEIYRAELAKMLNWMDWLGVLVKGKSLTEEALIFDSVGPQMVRAINAGRSLIESGIRQNGSKYWSGLLTLAHALAVEWVREFKL